MQANDQVVGLIGELPIGFSVLLALGHYMGPVWVILGMRNRTDKYFCVFPSSTTTGHAGKYVYEMCDG